MEATSSAIALVDVPPSLMRRDLDRRVSLGHRFQDLTGSRFSRCRVIGLAGFLKEYATWLCECDCGNLFIARGNSIKHRDVGCGCGHQIHGLSKTYWAGIYRGMMQRCYNPNRREYENYGGRGIKVCRRWRESIEAFVEDMGPRPSDSHSIDRINNHGDYEKSNCRWATQQEQCLNRRGLRWIEYNGERLTHSDWARRLDITRERFRQRVEKCISLGADPAEAITTPAGETLPCVLKAKHDMANCKDATELPLTNKTARLIAPVLHLLDGNVHHLKADEAAALTGGRFDYVMRAACKHRGLTANIRGLGDHILFRAS